MNILLPTDGSRFSVAAARACARLAAREDDAAVRVISVVETLRPEEPFDPDSDYYKAVQTAARESAGEMVEAARKILLSVPGNEALKVETKTVSGRPDAMIIRECEEWPADLVVMASHGYGFWARTLLGSTSDSVVHLAPCSVLIVRPHLEE